MSTKTRCAHPSHIEPAQASDSDFCWTCPSCRDTTTIKTLRSNDERLGVRRLEDAKEVVSS